MSQLTKISSRLVNLSKGTICGKSIEKSSLTEFSNLGNIGHCGLASLSRSGQQTVVMCCPLDLQDQIGNDKYFAEMDGSTITAVAATLKLLAEERLRKETNVLKVSINQILKATPRRNSASTVMNKMILADL